MLAPFRRTAIFFLAVLAAAVAGPVAVAAPSLPASANLTLDLNSAVVTGTPPAGADPSSDLQHGCEFRFGFSPTITISAGGVIGGGCNWSREPGGGWPWSETWVGSYSGTVASNGQATFSHSATHTMVDPPTGFTVTYSVTFQGSTQFHDDSGGAGNASFTFNRSCSPGTSTCPAGANLAYAGTVPFFITYSPISGADAQVDHIEVVQVVQTATNSVPLVANKTTVARVFVSSLIEVPIVSVTLKARRNGVLIGDTPVLLAGSATTVPEFFDREVEGDSVNFRLPMSWVTAGTIELEAVLVHSGPPDPNLSNNTRFENVTFQTRRPMTIYHTEICIGPPPATCAYDEESAKPQKFETLYPLPNGGLIYRRLPSPSAVVNPAAFSTPERSFGTLIQLGKFKLLRKLRSPDKAGDQLIGWVPSVPWWGGAADMRINGGSGQAAFVTWLAGNPEFSYDTLLHEVAHNLGSRHAATPDSCGSVDAGTDWPYANGRVQEVGWDMRTDDVIPTDYHDIMSYCREPGGTRMMSPFTYTKLFHANGDPAWDLATRVAGTYTVVSGTIKADGSGGTLDPIQSAGSTADFPPSDPAGTHCLRFNNSPAFDYCFPMSFHGSNHQPLDEAAFVVAAPYGGIFNSLMLCKAPCGPADTLATLTATPNWPAVSFLTPQVQDTLAGASATVSWTGTDADAGTVLKYTLYQSTDGGGNYTPLVVDTTATSFTFDARELQQGTSFFMVVASDGLNSSTATVGTVTVGTPRPWGDQTCDGAIGVADALALRKAVAGLSPGGVAMKGCPATGGIASLDVMPHSITPIDLTWGDLDCTGGVAANDVLAVLRAIAGLPVGPGTGLCPDVGEPVYATG